MSKKKKKNAAQKSRLSDDNRTLAKLLIVQGTINLLNSLVQLIDELTD